MSENIKMKGIAAHHFMRASLDHFEKRYDELNDKQKHTVEQDAQQSIDIEILVLGSPEAAGVVIPPSSLDQTFTDVKSRYDSPEDFEQDLQSNGLSSKSLRRALERELMVEAVLEKVAAAAPPVLETDVQAWYDQHPERFLLPDTRTVRHILITINEAIPENSHSRALALITDLHTRCNDTCEQFHNLAQRHSECPSALQGGLIGRVPRGKLYSQLDKALFKMNAGETSDILESETGFHILRCDKIHPPGTISFDEAAPKIRDAINKKNRQKAQTLWLAAKLKNKAVLKKNPSKPDEKQCQS